MAGFTRNAFLDIVIGALAFLRNIDGMAHETARTFLRFVDPEILGDEDSITASPPAATSGRHTYAGS